MEQASEISPTTEGDEREMMGGLFDVMVMEVGSFVEGEEMIQFSRENRILLVWPSLQMLPGDAVEIFADVKATGVTPTLHTFHLQFQQT